MGTPFSRIVRPSTRHSDGGSRLRFVAYDELEREGYDKYVKVAA